MRFESASELATVYEKDVSVIMYDIYLKIAYKYQCIYIFKMLEIPYLKQVFNFYQLSMLLS